MSPDKVRERLFRETFIANLITITLFTIIYLIVGKTNFNEFFYVSLALFAIFTLALISETILLKRMFYPGLETVEKLLFKKDVSIYEIKKSYIDLKSSAFYFSFLSITIWFFLGTGTLFIVYNYGIISLVKFLLIILTFVVTILVSHIFHWYFIKNNLITSLRVLAEELVEWGEEETLQKGLNFTLRFKILLIFFALLTFSAGIIALWGVGQVNWVRRNLNESFMNQILAKIVIANSLGENPQRIIKTIAPDLNLTRIDPKGTITDGELLPSDLLSAITTRMARKLTDNKLYVDNYLVLFSPPLDDGTRFILWTPWNNFSDETISVIRDYTIIFFFLLVLVGSIIYLAANDWRGITNALKVYLARVRRGNFRKGIIIYTDDELGDIGSYLNQVHDFFKNSIADARQLAMFIENSIGSIDNATKKSSSLVFTLKLFNNEINKIVYQHKQFIAGFSELFADLEIEEIKPQNLQILTIATGKTKGTINTIVSQANFIKNGLEENLKFINTLQTSLKILKMFYSKFKEKIDILIENSQLISTRVTSIESNLKRVGIYDARNAIFTMRMESTESDLLENLDFLEKRLGELYSNLQELEKVLSFIYELSEDTKILSLNASIISSHAEEEGKSFSVIANQIQLLASITGESISTTQQVLAELSNLREVVLEKTSTFKEKFSKTTLSVKTASDQSHLDKLSDSINALNEKIDQLNHTSRTLFQTTEEIDSTVDKLEIIVDSASRSINSYLSEIKKISQILQDISQEVQKATPFAENNIQHTDTLNRASENYILLLEQLKKEVKELNLSAEEMENSSAEIDKELDLIRDALEEVIYINENLLQINERLERLLIRGFKL